jgi:hypothetical protein
LTGNWLYFAVGGKVYESRGEGPMEDAILTHYRSRRRILITNAVIVAFMFPFLYLMAYLSDFRGMPLWICVALLIFNLAMFGHSSWKVYSQSKDFSCALYRNRICCECPDDTAGNTFDIPLAHIREIRRKSGGEGADKYTLVTADGHEYWLTSNFGNPAGAFARELKVACPHTTWIEK